MTLLPIAWISVVAAISAAPLNQEKFVPVALRFEPTLEAAFERAQREKIPVMVCIVMDNEAGNDALLAGLYRDRDIGELSSHAACVIANRGTHAEMEEPAGDATRIVCSRFGSVTCAQHLAVEDEVRKRWIKGDVVIAPQHIFLDASGKEIARHAYLPEAEKLKRMIQLARYVVDPTSVPRSSVEKELKAAKDLYKDAESKNESVRKPAIDQLANFEDPAAFQLLVKLATGKTDDFIRLEAIRAIGQKGSYRALEVLLDLLGEKATLIRCHSVVALERVKLPEAAPALLALYRSDTSERVRGGILRTLALCAPKDPAAVALILKEAVSSSSQIRLDDAVALAFLDGEPRALHTLRKIADTDGSSTLRGVAVWGLGRLRDAESRPLLTRIAESDKVGEVRTAAENALKAITREPGEEDDSGFSAFVRDEVPR